MGKMGKKIPSRAECYRILRQNKVPEHIVAHCEKVATIATFLAKELQARGEPINIALVEAAALLHDCTKHISLRRGENHAQSAARLLCDLGYPEVAQIVAQHIFLRPGLPGSPITEEEIVYYADKRVMHTKIVPIRVRFEDLRMRYGKTVSSLIRLYELEDITKLLERRIFKRLDFGPEKIQELDNG